MRTVLFEAFCFFIEPALISDLVAADSISALFEQKTGDGAFVI